MFTSLLSRHVECQHQNAVEWLAPRFQFHLPTQHNDGLLTDLVIREARH